MEERGRSSLTRAGRWWIVSMVGSTTPRSSGTRWSRSWTWCVTTPGGLQHPQLSSMLAVSSVTFSSVRLLTGEKMKIISMFQSENIWRYGRRFAFFMTLFMAVSLSVATAFSPNYWIYTIIRCSSNWSQNVFQVNRVIFSEQLMVSPSQLSSRYLSFSVSKQFKEITTNMLWNLYCRHKYFSYYSLQSLFVRFRGDGTSVQDWSWFDALHVLRRGSHDPVSPLLSLQLLVPARPGHLPSLHHPRSLLVTRQQNQNWN